MVGFKGRMMVCAATVVVLCGALRADSLERIKLADAGCAAYVAPETFDFLAWDRTGPRDPCYLGEIKALLAFLKRTQDPDDIEIINGRLAELYAQVGDERAAGRVIQAASAPREAPKGHSSKDGYGVTDAVSYIADRAATVQIVILNEDHTAPRHRDFARQLLKPLREQGYTHFAAEAFEGNPEAFSRSLSAGPPTFASGTYVRDPAFGRLIREAQALGYELVPYEAFEAVNGAAPNGGFEYHVYRETSQAKNLQARVFAKDPKAKLFVYAGFSHVIEEPVRRTRGSGTAKWMAAELKTLSGKNPLTIDQVSLTPALDAKWDGEDYSAIAPLLRGAKPMVVLKGDAPADLGFYGDKVDIAVAHPRLKDMDGRPGWVLRQGGPFRSAAAVAPSPGLVQLRVRGEPPDAIPFDQMLVPKAGSVALLSPNHQNVSAVFIPWD